ncbi:ATP-binding cassette domain-containing protein [Nakamurella silvestris]|nr:ATP-binding cassette domain-containing protein [Nakamurella silvestris]
MITLSSLRKVYPVAGGEIVALDTVDLEVGRGAIFGVVGPSGAGKSTLVRCLAMLDRPTSGKIIVNDEDFTSTSARKLRRARHRIGMVFQHVNLLENRTAAKNVSYPLEIAGVPAAARQKRVAELLALVGLADRGGSYPAQLSGGQKQRVGIARALANDPDVLLCDEPTSALDPTTTAEILTLLKDLRDRLGVTIIIITHEMSVVKQVCDHVAVLEAGRIAYSGPLLDVIGDPDSGMASALLPLPAAGTPTAGRRSITVTFSSAKSPADFVSTLARRFDVDIAIEAASVEPVQGNSLGRLRLGLDHEVDPAPIVEYLQELGLWVEAA